MFAHPDYEYMINTLYRGVYGEVLYPKSARKLRNKKRTLRKNRNRMAKQSRAKNR